MTQPIRIVLVDDHRVVTRSLKAYLESFADLVVVGTATNGEDLLEHLDEWKPQVVLQDAYSTHRDQSFQPIVITHSASS
jgi:NarL family two-component system response regulator LiaR